MARPIFVPWSKIALLAALTLPVFAGLAFAGLQVVACVIGFLVGMMSSIFATRGWAIAAPLVAMAAYGVFLVLPPWGLYAIGGFLGLAGIIAAPYGGGRVGAFVALGWAFLALSFPGGVDPILLPMFFAGAVWAIIVASITGLADLDPPSGGDLGRAPILIGVLVSLGFVGTLWLAQNLDVARPYWIPLVFLQVLGTGGIHTGRSAARRMLGALLGAGVSFVVSAFGPPVWLLSLLSGLAFFAALRITMAYPIYSRALTTAALLWALHAVSFADAETRILAEVVAAGLLLALAVGVELISRRVERAETR
ncbi:MAG: FUSC family protein [Rhodobacteraceae bacterium]|nr:FUSC family protein [Paracoccaceae bacterium]